MIRSAAKLALLAPLLLAACGGDAPSPAAPPQPAPAAASQPAASESSPVDQEALALRHAEEEIDRAFPDAHRERASEKADTANTREEQRGVPTSSPKPVDPCAVACKALGAMASSAERLCRLSGESDARCGDARARVLRATARVKSACPACTVP